MAVYEYDPTDALYSPGNWRDRAGSYFSRVSRWLVGIEHHQSMEEQNFRRDHARTVAYAGGAILGLVALVDAAICIRQGKKPRTASLIAAAAILTPLAARTTVEPSRNLRKVVASLLDINI